MGPVNSVRSSGQEVPAEEAASGGSPCGAETARYFDAAAGKDTYEPEKIMAERLAKGVWCRVPGEVGVVPVIYQLSAR